MIERCLEDANVRLTFLRYTGYGATGALGALTRFRFRQDNQNFSRGTAWKN
jgi:hypothetical protein